MIVGGNGGFDHSFVCCCLTLLPFLNGIPEREIWRWWMVPKLSSFKLRVESTIFQFCENTIQMSMHRVSSVFSAFLSGGRRRRFLVTPFRTLGSAIGIARVWWAKFVVIQIVINPRIVTKVERGTLCEIVDRYHHLVMLR